MIGPGSTVELASPKQLRIAAGEIKIKAEGKSPVELVGPDGKKIAVDGHADLPGRPAGDWSSWTRPPAGC